MMAQYYLKNKDISTQSNVRSSTFLAEQMQSLGMAAYSTRRPFTDGEA